MSWLGKCNLCGYDVVSDEDGAPVCSNVHCYWPYNEVGEEE